MLTVACVLRSGSIYDATWVARLKAGVAKHLPLAHKFVCLSDVEVPCERIALEHGWPGWWSKLELFKLHGPVLALDLDTAIVGDLSDIGWQAMLPSGFTILEDFYRTDGLGSGVMAWDEMQGTETVRRWFDVFARDPGNWIKVCGVAGDQNFIERQLYKSISRWQRQAFLEGQIVSYKVHCRNGIPPNARVVCLHGRPKFADMPVNDPVRTAWEMAA